LFGTWQTSSASNTIQCHAFSVHNDLGL
jgi:hypothetical protein